MRGLVASHFAMIQSVLAGLSASPREAVRIEARRFGAVTSMSDQLVGD